MRNLPTYEEWSIHGVEGTDWSFLPESVCEVLVPAYMTDTPPKGRLKLNYIDEIQTCIEATSTTNESTTSFVLEAHDKPHKLFWQLLKDEPDADKDFIKSLWKHPHNKKVIKALKDFTARPRPYWIDTRVTVTPGAESDDFSFPSGHATGAFYMASVLSNLFPHRKDDIFDLANQIADSRVKAGVHFPSDVEAGRLIGKALYDAEIR